MLGQASTSLIFATPGPGLLDITRPIEQWLCAASFDSGVLTVFVRHAFASLLVQEKADPEIRGDLDRFFARLVPDVLFRHHDEGPDDMPAHIRAARTAVQRSTARVGGMRLVHTVED